MSIVKRSQMQAVQCLGPARVMSRNRAANLCLSLTRSTIASCPQLSPYYPYQQQQVQLRPLPSLQPCQQHQLQQQQQEVAQAQADAQALQRKALQLQQKAQARAAALQRKGRSEKNQDSPRQYNECSCDRCSQVAVRLCCCCQVLHGTDNVPPVLSSYRHQQIIIAASVLPASLNAKA